MKKISRILLLILLSLSLAACTLPRDDVIHSLGKYQSKEFYSYNGFQAYTYYTKYAFNSVDVSDNKYLSLIEEDNIATLNEYLDHFEKVLNSLKNTTDFSAADLVDNYDFDRTLIDTEDYLYIYDHEGEPVGNYITKKFSRYNIYFFDTQTNVLYHFHNY